MLQSSPTKNGTGILIYGDYYDLLFIHDAIHQLADTLNDKNDEQYSQFMLLMNFAYEIRKTYEGSREILEMMGEPNDTSTHQYYGINLIWTDAILYLSNFKLTVGTISMNEHHLAVLYLLQGLIKNAIKVQDSSLITKFNTIIDDYQFTANKYSFYLYQRIRPVYLSQPQKSRFKDLPKLLRSYFQPNSSFHPDIITLLESISTENNISSVRIEYSEPTPEIVW